MSNWKEIENQKRFTYLCMKNTWEIQELQCPNVRQTEAERRNKVSHKPILRYDHISHICCLLANLVDGIYCINDKEKISFSNRKLSLRELVKPTKRELVETTNIKCPQCFAGVFSIQQSHFQFQLERHKDNFLESISRPSKV